MPQGKGTRRAVCRDILRNQFYKPTPLTQPTPNLEEHLSGNIQYRHIGVPTSEQFVD
jgi:hypothetical protein